MSFWGVGRRAGAVVAALLLVAACSEAEAEDPAEPSPNAPAEASETPTGASAEAAQDGGASAEADGNSSGNDDSAPPSPDPNRPEAQLPERPEAIDEHTVEGAIAAGKYFVKLVPYVNATGDLSQWSTLSHPDCEFCSNVRSLAEEMHNNGGFATGGTVQVTSADGGGPYENGVYIVKLEMRSSAMKFHHGGGKVESFEAETRPDFRLSLEWDDNDWVITGVRTGPTE